MNITAIYDERRRTILVPDVNAILENGEDLEAISRKITFMFSQINSTNNINSFEWTVYAGKNLQCRDMFYVSSLGTIVGTIFDRSKFYHDKAEFIELKSVSIRLVHNKKIEIIFGCVYRNSRGPFDMKIEMYPARNTIA